MKNLANCSSLIMIGIMALVVALGASLMPDVFAKENAGNPSIIEQIDQHDDNMIEEHEVLSSEHGVLDTKLDQVLNGGGGDCTDCPDAWSKQLGKDRFVLVMPPQADAFGEAVLDKETCLVWEQSPDIATRTWANALSHCFNKKVGGRKGWRVPTIEELATLVDDTLFNPALPSGHPFSSVQSSSMYWSSTTNADFATSAWFVYFLNGDVTSVSKGSSKYVWCVRGGQGHDAY